jgi:hypothetical protein
MSNTDPITRLNAAFLRVVNVRLTFTKDGSGEVDGLVLRHASRSSSHPPADEAVTRHAGGQNEPHDHQRAFGPTRCL